MAVLTALQKSFDTGITQSNDELTELLSRDITSDKMVKAINEWFALYYDEKHSENIDTSQRLPYVIVDTIYKTVFSQYELNVNSDNVIEKAEEITKSFLKIQAGAFQQILVGGEILIKPILDMENKTFNFVSIPRNFYTVLSRNTNGLITSVLISEVTRDRDKKYTLIEERTVEYNQLYIRNRLFEQQNTGISSMYTEAKRISLQTRYPDLEDEIILDIDNIGLIYAKNKNLNCVENSKEGVSIYAAATNAILKTYEHEKRTANEYKVTEPRLIASVDLFNNRMVNGREVRSDPLPTYIQTLNQNPQDVGVVVYNPVPNQVPLEDRGNQLLRNVENIIGLRRGALSEVSQADLTATEIKVTSARFDMVVIDCEEMWKECVNRVFKICYQLGKIYFKWTDEEIPTVSVGWGDGILYDSDKEYQRLLTAVQGGYLKPEYLLQWLNLHNLKEEEIKELQQDFMPSTQSGLQFGLNEYGE